MSFVNPLVLVLHLICDALHDLVPSVQFKKLDKRLWKTKLQCFMYQKENKKPIHWNSAVPKSYKRNVIIGDVHRAKKNKL